MLLNILSGIVFNASAIRLLSQICQSDTHLDVGLVFQCDRRYIKIACWSMQDKIFRAAPTNRSNVTQK